MSTESEYDIGRGAAACILGLVFTNGVKEEDLVNPPPLVKGLLEDAKEAGGEIERGVLTELALRLLRGKP